LDANELLPEENKEAARHLMHLFDGVFDWTETPENEFLAAHVAALCMQVLQEKGLLDEDRSRGDYN